MSGGTTRRGAPAAETPTPSEPREHAVSAALDRTRAARQELQDMRRTREEAVKRADAAIRALGSAQPAPGKGPDRVQDALDNIGRVTRIPTPGDRG
jgi:hypothetical protein